MFSFNDTDNYKKDKYNILRKFTKNYTKISIIKR